MHIFVPANRGKEADPTSPPPPSRSFAVCVFRIMCRGVQQYSASNRVNRAPTLLAAFTLSLES